MKSSRKSPVGLEVRPPRMKGESITFLGAFILGLIHTLEPCEDKAVVSLFIMWAAKRLREALVLVILYGLGMTLIDTALGAISAYLGASLLAKYGPVLRVAAGAITALFGLYVFVGAEAAHLLHHHGKDSLAEASSETPRALSIFGLGLVRGLPPCPFELAILAWAASMGSIWRGTLTVFVFGLGTTLGLIPLGLVMGGLAGAASRSRYRFWIPKICGALMMAMGVFLALSH